jgi:hypothetical protein
MTQKIVEMVHDSITEEFTPTCRHCKGTADEHAEGDEVTSGPCLFDATTWDPMTESEWVEWRRNLWANLGKEGASLIRDRLQQPTGTAFIRDILKQSVFASRIETDEMIYGNAGIEVTTDADKLTIKRLDPLTMTVAVKYEDPK